MKAFIALRLPISQPSCVWWLKWRSATILMIVANTMFFAIREAEEEIGVLKVLGFSRRFILCNILAETFALFAIGLGLGLGFAFTAIMFLRRAASARSCRLSCSPLPIVLGATGLAVLLALATGVAAGLQCHHECRPTQL